MQSSDHDSVGRRHPDFGELCHSPKVHAYDQSDTDGDTAYESNIHIHEHVLSLLPHKLKRIPGKPCYTNTSDSFGWPLQSNPRVSKGCEICRLARF